MFKWVIGEDRDCFPMKEERYGAYGKFGDAGLSHIEVFVFNILNV